MSDYCQQSDKQTLYVLNGAETKEITVPTESELEEMAAKVAELLTVRGLTLKGGANFNEAIDSIIDSTLNMTSK